MGLMSSVMAYYELVHSRGNLDITCRGTTNREHWPIQSIRSCHLPIYLNQDTVLLVPLTRLRFARGDTNFQCSFPACISRIILVCVLLRWSTPMLRQGSSKHPPRLSM